MKPIRYLSFPIRMAAAAIACLIVIFSKCWHCIPNSVIDPDFYINFLVSFLVAIGLVIMIHFVTVRLDRLYDWKQVRRKRIWTQLVFGLVIPALADLGLMSAFLLGAGQKFNYHIFLGNYPSVVLFILILNLYYVIHYLTVNWRRAEQRQKPQTKKIPVIEIRNSGIIADVPLNEVMFFYSLNKKVYLRTISGEEHRVNSKLADLVDQYGQYDFFQINPSVIINRAITNGYRGKDRYLKRIILKSEFADKIKEIDRNKLEITRKWIPVARKWFGKELKDPDENQSSEKK